MMAGAVLLAVLVVVVPRLEVVRVVGYRARGIVFPIFLLSARFGKTWFNFKGARIGYTEDFQSTQK